MVTITCDVYEKHEFLKILEYAKEKKKEDYRKGLMTDKMLEIELDSIHRLTNRVNGIYKEDYLMLSKTGREKEPPRKEYTGLEEDLVKNM